MPTIGVYGTLRNGGYNHSPSMGEPLFSGKVSIPYKMLLPYSYPALVRDGKVNPIYIEVYDVSDETYSWISAMESGAGYEMSIIDTPVGKVIIWVWKEETYKYYRDAREVPSGDYIEEISKRW